MNGIREELNTLMRRAGACADPLVLERMEAFHALLTERNRQMDLTNVPEGEMASRHYLDSLLPAIRYPSLFPERARVVDVGSGAGFPGIPLAVYRPDLRVTLLEANGRRCDFLRDAIGRLSLEAEVLYMRAEEAGQDSRYRERADLTVSRAVAPLRTLLELMLPLTAVGGAALCWKGRRAEEEMGESEAAARTLGGGSMACLPYGLPEDEGCVIRIAKDLETPARYPRRPGMPAKRPLE